MIAVIDPIPNSGQLARVEIAADERRLARPRRPLHPNDGLAPGIVRILKSRGRGTRPDQRGSLTFAGSRSFDPTNAKATANFVIGAGIEGRVLWNVNRSEHLASGIGFCRAVRWFACRTISSSKRHSYPTSKSPRLAHPPRRGGICLILLLLTHPATVHTAATLSWLSSILAAALLGPRDSDKDVLSRIASGDQQALKLLYSQVSDRAMAIALRVVKIAPKPKTSFKKRSSKSGSAPNSSTPPAAAPQPGSSPSPKIAQLTACVRAVPGTHYSRVSLRSPHLLRLPHLSRSPSNVAIANACSMR